MLQSFLLKELDFTLYPHQRLRLKNVHYYQYPFVEVKKFAEIKRLLTWSGLWRSQSMFLYLLYSYYSSTELLHSYFIRSPLGTIAESSMIQKTSLTHEEVQSKATSRPAVSHISEYHHTCPPLRERNPINRQLNQKKQNPTTRRPPSRSPPPHPTSRLSTPQYLGVVRHV